MAERKQPRQPAKQQLIKPRGKAIKWTDADIDAMFSDKELQKRIQAAQDDVAEKGSPALNSLLNSTEIKSNGNSATPKK